MIRAPDPGPKPRSDSAAPSISPACAARATRNGRGRPAAAEKRQKIDELQRKIDDARAGGEDLAELERAAVDAVAALYQAAVARRAAIFEATKQLVSLACTRTTATMDAM